MRVTRTEGNESYFQSEPRGFIIFNYIVNTYTYFNILVFRVEEINELVKKLNNAKNIKDVVKASEGNNIYTIFFHITFNTIKTCLYNLDNFNY